MLSSGDREKVNSEQVCKWNDISVSFRSRLLFGADRTFPWECVVGSRVAEAWRGRQQD